MNINFPFRCRELLIEVISHQEIAVGRNNNTYIISCLDVSYTIYFPVGEVLKSFGLGVLPRDVNGITVRRDDMAIFSLFILLPKARNHKSDDSPLWIQDFTAFIVH